MEPVFGLVDRGPSTYEHGTWSVASANSLTKKIVPSMFKPKGGEEGQLLPYQAKD